MFGALFPLWFSMKQCSNDCNQMLGENRVSEESSLVPDNFRKYRIKHNPKMNIFLVLNKTIKNTNSHTEYFDTFIMPFSNNVQLVENGIINVSKYSVCEFVFSMVFI